MFSFVFGLGEGKCPHFPAGWQFYSQTTQTIVNDATMTVSCSPGAQKCLMISEYQ